MPRKKRKTKTMYRDLRTGRFTTKKPSSRIDNSIVIEEVDIVPREKR